MGNVSEQADELDQTYQVLKEANVLKKPGSSGSGGSGNGFHGSCQTLHSQHEMTPARHIGRSNPSVNIIPGPGSSGHNTPAGPGHPMSVAAAPASGKEKMSLAFFTLLYPSRRRMEILIFLFLI